MCRLAMFNKEGLNYIEETMGVLSFLNHLENQCGGQGNGIALIKDNKIAYVRKGTKYKNKEIASLLLNRDFDYALYHTRVASVSSVGNENCHPFVTKKRDFLLMMNGTERSIGDLAKTIGITDTELVFRIIRDYGVSLKALTDLSSRYMGFKDGKVFVCNTEYQSLEFIESRSGGLIIASSFPDGIKSNKLKHGMWYEGDKLFSPKKQIVQKTKTKWNDLSGINYAYDYEQMEWKEVE